MAKQKKSTKKFEKTQLKSVLSRRNDLAKVKKKHKLIDKRKKDSETRRNIEEEHARAKSAGSRPKKAQDNPDQDEYFQEPIKVPQLDKNVKEKNKDKRKVQESEDDVDDAEPASGTGSDSEDDPETYQNQLSSLQEKDPEFYKYLQDNEADLLDFDEDADLAESDDLSEDEAHPPSKKQKMTKEDNTDEASDVTTVTLDMIEKWKQSMTEQYSLRSLRQIVLAFRAAADTADEKQRSYKYSIPDSQVYHELLVTALQQIPPVLNHHLPIKETTTGKVRISTDSSKFRTLSPMIKSHVSSINHLLGQLSDSPTLRLALQSVEPLLPYLLQFRKLLKVIIKTISSVWSDRTSDEATRITAFLILRRLMVIGDPGLLEAVLKSAYEGVVKGSRNTTVHSLPAINLMKNSAAELWGIDQKLGYTTGFTFIRQLAIHLRGNITKPTKDSYKTIYNWQFVHSLDFWSRVLSTHCNSLLEAQNGKESQLRPLIYPTVQITLGVMRLIPTSTYFPLRFQLIRSLLRISQATGTYIPLSSALLEVLNSPEMKKPAKQATLRPLDFESNIRTPAPYISTRIYQEGIGDQVIELFSEFFVLWSKSIAYPELQLPVMTMIKRWLKQATSRNSNKTTTTGGGNKNAKLNQNLLLLVQKSESNAKWIEERRNQVTYAPRDRSQVESFLKDVNWEDTPLGAFVVGQRKMREERKKILDAGRLQQRNQKGRSNDNDDGDDQDWE